MPRWVRLSERMPTLEDADYSTFVLCREWGVSRQSWAHLTISLGRLGQLLFSQRQRIEWLENVDMPTEVTSVTEDGRMISMEGE